MLSDSSYTTEPKLLAPSHIIGVESKNSENVAENLPIKNHQINAEHYCRICGLIKDPSNFTPIFGEQGHRINLHMKIVYHLHLQVEKEDHLPHQVCKTCIGNLDICHQMFETSRTADIKLRQLFLNSQASNKNSAHLNPGENVSDFEITQNSQENLSDSATTEKYDTTSSLLCHICGKYFNTPRNLKTHKKIHLEDSLKKKHSCGTCDKSFRSKFHLSEHMNVHNGVSPYSCQQCSKSFHKRAQLRQHSQIHAAKRAVCEVCGLRFSRRSHLLAHVKTHAEHRTFSCRLCSAQLPSLSALLSHRKLHSQDDIRSRLSHDMIKDKEHVFSCEICGKLLTNKASLVSHLEQHKPGTVRRHECEECGKLLRSRKSLAYHRKSQHSVERPFKCSTCSEGFMSRQLLAAHETRHTGEKPFKCEVCWMGFRSRSNLNQHMSKHTGTKNFECTFCGKQFFRKGALTVHNRKHTGEKPFICDLCGRPFQQKNDMMKHQKTHSEANRRTRTCDLCLTVFTSNKELTKHKEEAHKEKSPNIIPLIITNSLYETHIITEDGQKIVFTTVETVDNGALATSSTST